MLSSPDAWPAAKLAHVLYIAVVVLGIVLGREGGVNLCRTLLAVVTVGHQESCKSRRASPFMSKRFVQHTVKCIGQLTNVAGLSLWPPY
jgi:hypothetical protein